MSSSESARDLPKFYSPNSPYAIHISRFPRDGIIVIRKYIALGRDGITFCCLNAIAGLPNAELAIIPYGIGNDFVMSFGGKEIISEMRNIKAQVQDPVIPTDIIDCGNIYALNSCAVGLEALALRRSYPLLKTFWKIRCRFPMITLAILRVSGVVEMFDREIRERYYQIQLVFYQPSSIVMAMRFMPQYLTGKHRKFHDICTYRRVRYVSIRSDQPFGICLDGEVFFDTSFSIRIVPKAVRIASVGGRPFKDRSLDYAD